MPNKRTRERHLAKVAARRQAQRRASVRRRNRIVATAAGLVTALVVFVVGINLVGGGGKSTASPTPSVSPKPGSKIGTVKPAANIPKRVACGAAAPKDATQPKPQFAGPPPVKIDHKATYTATIDTTCGRIVVELFPKQAPLAVNNFVFLAQHHLYPGTWFHRIAPGFVIQGGDPKGDGTGGPGYQFKNEIVTGLNFDAVGMLGMANSGPNTNGSQWFITLAPSPSLDGKYTVFGKVIKGLDVVQNIGRVPVTIPPGAPAGAAPETPKRTIYIDKVTITAGA